MKFQEGINLILEKKTEEALEYFTQQYKITKNLLCKYYICKLFYKNNVQTNPEQAYTDFTSLLKLPVKYHKDLYFELMFFSFLTKRYEHSYHYSQKILKDNIIEDYLVFYIHATSLLIAKNDCENAILYYEKTLLFDNTPLDILAVCYHALISIFVDNKEVEKSRKLINLMYFKKIDILTIYKCEILHATIAEEDENLLFYLEKLKDNQEYYHHLTLAYEYYFLRKNKDLITKLSDELLTHKETDESSKSKIELDLISLDIDNGEYEIALNKINNTHFFEDFLNTQKTIFKVICLEKMDEIKHFELIEKIYFEQYTITKKYDYLSSLSALYFSNNFFDKMFENAQKSHIILKNNHKKTDYLNHYYFAVYYMSLGKFKKADWNLQLALKKKCISLNYYIMFKLSIIKKNKFIEKILMNSIHSSEDDFSKVNTIKINYLELYEQKFDQKMCLSLSRSLYHDNIYNPRFISVYAYIILNSDPKLAFELLEKGSNIYSENKNNDSSCVPLLSYCLYNGIGTIQAKEKAKTLIDTILLDNKNKYIKESNVIYLKTYYNIIDDKNLKETYDLIKNYFSKRYDLTKYILMSRLEKLLFKKITKKTAKFLKSCFKNSSLREREFYLNKKSVSDIFISF